MTEKISFEKAYKRLKEVNELLKSDEIIDVNVILKLQKEAKKMYDFCKKELKKLD